MTQHARADATRSAGATTSTPWPHPIHLPTHPNGHTPHTRRLALRLALPPALPPTQPIRAGSRAPRAHYHTTQESRK